MQSFSFFSLTRSAVESELSKHFGFEKASLRAKNIFHEVYKDELHSENIQFQNVSHAVREFLFSRYHFSAPVKIKSFQVSEHDLSVKFAMELHDGKLIETVLIPERARLTLCVSSQVGCAQACRFCQTGRMGLLRSLSTAEIVGQLVAVERWRKMCSLETLKAYRNITNVVYMGMGEPLDNVDNVLDSVRIFCDPQAFFLSHNKVTLSTVGMLPALPFFLQNSNVSVALSLHSPFDDERTKIMPVNKSHPIQEVIAVLRSAVSAGLRRSFMVQYTLLRGVNDTEAHAVALAELLAGVGAKINLIPLNEHSGSAFRRPDLGRVYGFQHRLKELGCVATVRLSKGRDIAAACGQLIENMRTVAS